MFFYNITTKYLHHVTIQIVFYIIIIRGKSVYFVFASSFATLKSMSFQSTTFFFDILEPVIHNRVVCKRLKLYRALITDMVVLVNSFLFSASISLRRFYETVAFIS